MSYTINDIAVMIGSSSKFDDTLPIEYLLTDSRKLLFPATTLFFAISGPRRNANIFIPELYKKGVRNFIVDKTFPANDEQFSGAHFIIVKDVLQSLQDMVSAHRKKFTFPVIGITGSNGKTIVKEWLYQLLQEDQHIVRNPKSYNSQVGVPLSVWQMNATHTMGIFEAGISQTAEMERLEKVIAPNIGILTNIGEAHSEGFADKRQKIEEKLKLFRHSEILIYNADDAAIHEAVLQFKHTLSDAARLQLFNWSRFPGTAVHVKDISRVGEATNITLQYGSSVFDCSIPFTDTAAIENAINCICVLLHLGINVMSLSEKLHNLRPVEMRLELKQGINNCSIINDSYSADMNSLAIALDFLQQQQQHAKRTLILSDILQTGKNVDALYADVALMLAQKKINRFIGIGPDLMKAQEAFAAIPEKIFFSSTADFRQQFYALHFSNESVLLKGARLFEFEQLVHLLEQKVHQTVLEINLNAITHNLKTYQQQLNPGVKIMAMVKAFSYGSGSFEIANLLQFHKVDYLAVAYADEGVALRKAGITLPIMVMNAEAATFDVMVYHNLEPELYSFSILFAFEKYLQESGITHYPVHIKLDTGMRRLGFEESDIALLCEKIRHSNIFKVQSVFSHLAASDAVAHDAFTEQQATAFFAGCTALGEVISYPFLRHIANTSAIHRHKDLQLDMVRLGIGLYGVDSNALMQQQLRNVTTLKTTISQIKNVKAGESVGYSRKGIATKDSTIATVGIGYADGYPRILGNGVGKMWLNGQLVPVIGNVCMDMTMLDITGITAAAGDDVTIFGEALPVEQVACWAQTIAYEVLTGISQRVKRVYFEE